MVPYIYEDFASQEDVANGLMKIYRMTPEEKESFQKKATSYVDEEFNYGKVISEWDRTLTATIESWREKQKTAKKWELLPLNLVSPAIPATIEKAPADPAQPKIIPIRSPKKMDPAILARLNNVKGKK
jgi:hypothetical protein